MILRKLTLQNFRPFKDETFEFDERVTVFAGVNGRGKSSILDAIAISLSYLLPQVSPARFRPRKPEPADIHTAETDLQLTLLASFGEIDAEFSVSAWQLPSRAGLLLPGVRQAILAQHGNMTAPIAVYYATDRAVYHRPTQLLNHLGPDQSAAYDYALFNRFISFVDFMSRYRTWINIVKLGDDYDGKNQRVIAMIDHVIREFLPTFDKLKVDDFPVQLSVAKADKRYDMAQLSDGERSLLAMLIDLCRRLVLANPGLDNPLLGTGVVMIDEIELHLHVRWQREIIEKLRTTFPNLQFILTTHSPFIVQTLHKGELRLLADDLDDDSLQDPGDYANRGLEEVATKVMGIENPNAVPRYTAMLDAARAYYQLLETATPDDEQQLRQLRAKLDELVAPFPDEPAYRAFLEVQRVAAFREGQRDVGEIDEAN